MSDQINLDAIDQAARAPSPPAESGRRAMRTATPPAPDAELHLTDAVKVLHKRRWTAATSFAIVVVAITVYTFTATPLYEARARLLIETENPNVVSFQQVIEDGPASADYYQTQYSILQSRALARRTIDELKLWDSPHFRSRVPEASALGRLRAFVTTAIGREAPPARPAVDETAAQSSAIDAFLGNLVVSPIRNSRLVDVRFRSPDAALVARVANVHAENFIEQDLEYRFRASEDATSWLDERLAEQRAQVEGAEAALQRYREAHDAISLDDRENIVVQKLEALNTAVTRAKTERLGKEAVFRQLRAIQQEPGALDTFPAILGNAYIQRQKAELADLQRQQAQLADTLGDRHPEMVKLRTAIQNSQQKLQAEIAKIVRSVRTEYEAAVAQENSLMAALDQQKTEALSMNRKAIEYGVLQREVESSRALYQSLLQRAKETGVSRELRTSNIRIVDEAEQPRAPFRPARGMNLVLALFGGFVCALGAAFFFEYLDTRIKTPDEIAVHLRLPALGMIPALGKSWSGAEPLINNGVPPKFFEAFRSVRTNILFSAPEERSRTVVITSAGPGEGKTTLASNLAIGFALAGHRVLLIDGDMRRPRLHDVFTRSQEPGLSNVLVGNAKASEAVQKTDVAGLWLLTAGRTPPNPAELLGSRRVQEFLQALGNHFDWIVIDTPPVMAVTDPVVAAHAATDVVFVIRAETTDRHTARAALDQLQKGGTPVIGAVLNRVDLDRNAYYYAKYYRREYDAYYHAAP